MSFFSAQRAEPCRYSFAFELLDVTTFATATPSRPTVAVTMPMLPARMISSGYWLYHFADQFRIDQGAYTCPRLAPRLA